MKITKKTLVPVFACLAIFLGKVGLVSAQVEVPSVGDEDTPLLEWVVDLLRYVIGLGGLVAAAVLIGNGFLYMTAGGDEGKIEKATKGITYAIIGLVIAAISFMVVNYVANEIIGGDFGN